MLYAKLAELPLKIDGYALEPLEQATASGWVRHTTVVRLRGGSAEGLGEDVTYGPEEQFAFRRHGAALPLTGTYTIESFSHHLDGLKLFEADPPAGNADRLFRRWAFESAALDLALRQADRSLAIALGREHRPVRFAVSTGLGEPPSIAAVDRVRRLHPEMRFKVDLAASWTEAFVRELAALDVVDVVDLKAHYHGAFTGPPPNADQYRWIAEAMPEVWLEDAWLEGECGAVLAGHCQRLSWDAVLHSFADVELLATTPTAVNIKPSRFGRVSELMRVYDWCEARGVQMYGGGQFELGPGRRQIQVLASLFHPATPNDVAPTGYNDENLPADLPASPLAAPRPAAGFAPCEAALQS